MQNPFTLSFGKKPLQYISRISQTNQIVETFRSENPATGFFSVWTGRFHRKCSTGYGYRKCAGIDA